MAKIGVPVDDVSGVIVGGNYGQAWITYEGRKQDLGEHFKYIYPKEDAWRFHYDGV